MVLAIIVSTEFHPLLSRLDECADFKYRAAVHLQQLTSMPFTSYLRQCLVDITEAKNHDLDQALVHFVKIQYLAERVAVLKTPQQRRIDLSNDKMALEGSEQDRESQERGAALAGCQAYLDRLARELPSGLKDNGTFTAIFVKRRNADL